MSKNSNKSDSKLKNKLRKQIQNVNLLKQNLVNLTGKIGAVQHALPTNPMQLRGMEKDDLMNSLLHFHQVTRAEYLYSMIHPEYAVENGIQVRMYSDVPIPTASIGIHQQVQFPTNKKGMFAISWQPNYLADKESIEVFWSKNQRITVGNVGYSNLFVNNDATLDGKSQNRAFLPFMSYLPEFQFEKYRLVSAVMKVRYNGPVLNQSGTLLSAAFFDKLPAFTFATTNTTSKSLDDVAKLGYTLAVASDNDYDPNRQRYTVIDTLRNGVWNYTQNITADANGIECLYVPLDNTSTTLSAMATYYGSEPRAKIQEITSPYNDTAYLVQNKPVFGAQMNYAVMGYNFPPDLDCVLIDIYYNFEVLPSANIAPLIRSSINTVFDANDHRRMKELFEAMAKQGFVRRIVDGVKEKFPSFAKNLLTWGPSILRLLK